MPNEVLRPPEGWTLVQNPTATRAGAVDRDATVLFDRETIEARYTTLRDWATENGLQLEPLDYSMVGYAQYLDVYCWTKFSVRRSDTPNNGSVIAAFPCTGCGHELRIGQVYCERCDRFVVCDSCHLAGLRLFGVRGQQGNGSCPACSVECASATCTNRMPRTDGFDRCADCDPRAGCAHCQHMVPMAQLVEHNHAQQGRYLVCPNCVATVCAECDGHFANTQDRRIGEDNLHICDACAQVHYDRERAKFERWDTSEMPVSGSLMIPGSTARPVRTVSIETEFDGDGVKVGRALASAGLLADPNRGAYRTRGNTQDRYPCLLKSDASVTGGELVTFLLDLDNDNHAAALQRMTEVMRGCREMGQAQFTHRAGGHIHIDLHGLTAKDLWAQYTLFNWLQMPIFYMAGAGADYGHRTLSGSGYTDAGPAGPFKTVGRFAQEVLGNGGRYALHFSNFNQAKARCACGAFITGNWDECTCNLGQATAEWRVWNAEVTPRILHGWLALMQALTAYTQGWEDFDESKFPPFIWTRKNFDALAASEKEKIKERLTWMHRELPLTLHERDSLIYVCKRSQLIGLGEDFLNGLLDVEANNAFGAKKPARNPGSRKNQKFALAAVAGAGDNASSIWDFEPDEDDEDDEPW